MMIDLLLYRRIPLIIYALVQLSSSYSSIFINKPSIFCRQSQQVWLTKI